MKTDAELLEEFVKRGSESAFAALVRRHINVVYSAACRETAGDRTVAEDITQLVFIELARKAAHLLKHPTLAGWLYTTVRYVAVNPRRGDHRRTLREEHICMEKKILNGSNNEPLWEEIGSVLDDAMHDLTNEDRDAVLLRYFESKTFGEVGHDLGLTENAARKRVERALEKLRAALGWRGIHPTSSALAAALAASLITAPPTLTASIVSAAITVATVSSASASTLLGAATFAKFTAIIGAAVVVAITIPLWQQQRYVRMAGENVTLRRQLKQSDQENERLAALLRAVDEHSQPPVRKSAAATPPANGQPKSSPAQHEPTWRQRFEAHYRLRGGEYVRRISPPFIPERTEFCRREFRNPKNLEDYLLLRQYGKSFHARSLGIDQGITQIEGVLRHVVELKRYEFYGADDLLATSLTGDWVIHGGARTEDVLTALGPILREATGRNVRFDRSAIDNDVIVVRGNFSPAKEWQKIDVFAEHKDKKWVRSSHGNLQQFLDALGDCLNVPFANEVHVEKTNSVAWFCHADSDYSHAGEKRLELLNKILANLQQQTTLSFNLENRSGMVWVIKENQ